MYPRSIFPLKLPESLKLLWRKFFNLKKKFDIGKVFASLQLKYSFFNHEVHEAHEENSVLCHPEGIFAVVGTAIASTCKDPYRMT